MEEYTVDTVTYTNPDGFQFTFSFTFTFDEMDF